MTSIKENIKNVDKIKSDKNCRVSGIDNMINLTKRYWKIIYWPRLIYLLFFNLGLIVAVSWYNLGPYPNPIKTLTCAWSFIYGYSMSLGVTAGAHRLWTHRAYKAKLPLRILLMILYCGVGVYSLRVWIKDHRQHHKYTDTDLDPHDSSKGLFWSHFGWIFIRRTPECARAGREIYLEDIRADPVVMFQDKYWLTLGLVICFLIPTVVPVIFWDETVLNAVITQFFMRYPITLNLMLMVNSIAHHWGYRPYNKSISAVDNPILSLLTSGEATHNYHHAFPQDYKATEFPIVNFNFTALFIRAMASLGLAYDLKEPSPEHLGKVKERYGYESLTSNNYSD